jgi:hypothetical protein
VGFNVPAVTSSELPTFSGKGGSRLQYHAGVTPSAPPRETADSPVRRTVDRESQTDISVDVACQVKTSRWDQQ